MALPKTADSGATQTSQTNTLPSAPATRETRPRPEAQPNNGYHRHDGFLLEFDLIADLQILRDTSSFEDTATGRVGRVNALAPTLGLAIAVGGATSPTITLGARFETTFGTPRAKVGAREVDLGDHALLASVALDAFFRWHLPHHLAVSAAVGLGVTVLSNQDHLIRRRDGSAQTGDNVAPGAGPLRVQASVMKLFWVSANWSTGALSRIAVVGPSGMDGGAHAVAIGLAWLWVYQ